MPVAQEGEESMSTGLGAVSSLLGNKGPGSAEMPSWFEATIVMQTREFAKKFILSQNIMQALIDEHGFDIIWDELSDTNKNIQLNRIARRWVGKNIEVEQDPDSNIFYFTVYSSDPELAVKWAGAYVKNINAHLKEHLIEENEHKIAFYRKRIEEEKINEIKSSIIGLLSMTVQKSALIDTRDEIVLRTIDPAEIAILNFPLLTLNIAIGIFIGLILAFVTVLFIGSYKRYLETLDDN